MADRQHPCWKSRRLPTTAPRFGQCAPTHMVVPCMTPSSVSSTLLGSLSRAFSPPASLVAYLAISTSREETLQSALLAAGPRGATPRVFQYGRRCWPNWRRGAWSSKRFLSGMALAAPTTSRHSDFTERGPGGHEHWPFASLS